MKVLQLWTREREREKKSYGPTDNVNVTEVKVVSPE